MIEWMPVGRCLVLCVCFEPAARATEAAGACLMVEYIPCLGGDGVKGFES